MEKRWTTFALLSTNNTIILDGKMDLSHLFNREDDHSSSQFTMKWCKWNKSCKFEEKTPKQEQKIIFINPIETWSVQHRKCNIKNHLKKTKPKQ
ncbi:hypothetical protein DN407_30950 (plasmid) [Bacillus sp. JAS24-2]|uniref:hypothetical protein n=1 Tax=Bacillus sp. JAS24-2 TaxID=2217832 RepID=UPI0011F09AC3|nr:hypothetical protein [Bacillus sp. JAS24-2]QEL82842.1 hypothetical protein DN407_30950 [Bacillus sp. JAS24-2]